MRYRLIAADLDDTLLDESSNISPRNREAIRKAVERGVKFIIATGRMFKTSVAYLKDLGLDGDCPLINYHGALIKTASSRRIIMHRPLSNKLALAVAEEAKRRDCHVSIFCDDDLFIKEENEYTRFYQTLAKIEMKPVGDLAAFIKRRRLKPSKISIIRWDGTIEDIEAGLKAKFGEQLSILQSRPFFLEITDCRATKGQALNWYAGQQGIDRREVIAIGDGHNDLDMILYAGLGVAVANARPKVIEAADLVTSAHNKDGVAEVIEKYVLN